MRKYEKSPLFKMSPAQKRARQEQRREYKRMAHQLARLEKGQAFGPAIELDLKMNHYRRQNQHSKEKAEKQVKHMIIHYQWDAKRVSIYKTLWARKKRAERNGNQQLADLIDDQMDAFRKINKHDPEYRAKMARRKIILHKQHNARYEAEHPGRQKIQRERMKRNPQTREHYYRKVRQHSHDAFQRIMKDPVKHARHNAYDRQHKREHYYYLRDHDPKAFVALKKRRNASRRRYMHRLRYLNRS